MSEINLVDFFRFYEHTQEQQKAVEMLQAVMPSSLLTDASPWVVQYRRSPCPAVAHHQRADGRDHELLGQLPAGLLDG